MIHSVHWVEGEPVSTALDPKAMSDAVRSGRGVLWVDIESPSEEESLYLDEVFGFHPLTIEDCLVSAAYPKLDTFDDYLFLVIVAPGWIIPGQQDSRAEAMDVAMYLGSNYVVTFHKEPVRSIAILRERGREAKPEDTSVAPGADHLFSEILDGIVDEYSNAVARIDAEAERYEQEMVNESGMETLAKVGDLRGHVLQVRRLMADEANVLARLSRRPSPFIREEIRPYLSDIFDHIDELLDKIELARDALDNARDLCLSLINLRTQEVMRVLTVITTVGVPFAIISGLYGMNVSLPWGGSGYAFLWVVGTTSVFVAAAVALMRWKKWL